MPLPTDRKNLSAARRIALLGILGAQAIALSFLESLLPPLPFLPPGGKAGFSNIITMYTAARIGLREALAVSLMKSIFVLLTRGATAFVMSLLGGLLSVLVMAGLLRTGKLGYIGVGVSGAVTHNLAQLCVAVWMTGTAAITIYFPVLMIFSLASGAITGLLLYCLLPAFQRQEKVLYRN